MYDKERNATQSGGIDYSSASTTRSCNWLESLFASANVRFVAGISLQAAYPRQRVLDAVGCAFKCLNGAQVTCLDSPTLSQGQSETILLPRVEPQCGKSIMQLVGDNTKEDMPSLGHPTVTLYYELTDATISAIVLNTNHALMDAIAVKRIFSILTKELMFSDSNDLEATGHDGHEETILKMVEWKSILLVNKNTDQIWKNMEQNDDQPFLSWGDELPLTAAQCLSSDKQAVSSPSAEQAANSIVVAFNRNEVDTALVNARRYSTTLTGLLMVCLSKSLAETYLAAKTDGASRQTCSIGMSVLVDLRRFLPEDKRDILQMQSTVTVSTTWDHDDGVETGLLFQRAEELTTQVKHRIRRGEAHRQALAFSSDELATEGAPIEATFELSNHGIYTAPGTVEVAQRFDGYEGLSIIVHSESETGAMKVSASFGDDLDHKKCETFMLRAAELFRSFLLMKE